MRKEHLGGTKRLKKLFEQRKIRSRPWLQDRSSSDLQSRYTEARKAATSAVKEIQGEVMGRVWSSVRFQLFFGKQSILADHSPFTWQKIEYHVLHQGF